MMLVPLLVGSEEGRITVEREGDEPIAVAYTPAKGSGWRVDYPRRRAVVAGIIEAGWLPADEPRFTVEPSWRPPFVAGRLADETLARALGVLNAYRALAGLGSAVVNDPGLDASCQHGAVLLAAQGVISHTPEAVADMPPAFFQRGRAACERSNLQAGFADLVRGLHLMMWDSDARNLARVGHRRWLLQPDLGRTGFGLAHSTSLVWALDHSDRTGPRPAWWSWPPAGWVPRALASRGMAWHLQLDPAAWYQPRREHLELRLTRLDSGYRPTEAIPAELIAVDTQRGGPGWAVVFRPEPGSLGRGEDRVLVEIEGLGARRGRAASPTTWLTHLVPWPGFPPPGAGFVRPGADRPRDRDREPAIDGSAHDIGDNDLPPAAAWALLQRVNRFRSDPAMVVPDLPRDGLPLPGLVRELDWALCERELLAAEPAPPLVWDPLLATAARGQAAWMQRNRRGAHIQAPGSPGFTGTNPEDRALAAGWRGAPVAENLVGPVVDTAHGHLALIVDQANPGGPERGGMRWPRSHRDTLLDRRFGVYGCALAEDPDGEIWQAELFAAASDSVRVVAGVVYTDSDRDGLVGPGEGLTGTLSIEGVGARRLSPGGGFQVVLPATGSATAALEITVDGRQAARREFDPRSPLRTWWEVVEPDPRDLRAAAAAITVLGDGAASQPSRRRAAADLAWLAVGRPEGSTLVELADHHLGADAEVRAEVVELVASCRHHLRTGAWAQARSQAASGARRWRGTRLGRFCERVGTIAAAGEAMAPIAAAATAGRSVDARRVVALGRQLRAVRPLQDAPLLADRARRLLRLARAFGL